MCKSPISDRLETLRANKIFAAWEGGKTAFNSFIQLDIFRYRRHPAAALGDRLG
jgi:hypothetical protein